MNEARLIEDGTLVLRVESDGDDQVLTLSGELDVSNAAVLEREVRAALDGTAPRIVLDLRELEFIDSTGLRTLLIAERLSAADSGRLNMLRPSGQVARMLALTGIGDEMRFTDGPGVQDPPSSG